MGIRLTFELPAALVEQARAAGILSNERIAALLKMELARQAAWERLNTAAAVIREAAKAEYGDLSEEDVLRLVNEEIHTTRSANT
jgi:hypothetical protein